MDEHQLMEEGFYNTYGRAGARTEMPGCSLCKEPSVLRRTQLLFRLLHVTS